MTVPVNSIRQYAVEPYAFRGLIPEQGYEWVAGTSDSELHLTMAVGPKKGGWAYSPLKSDPRLFLRFAKLKPQRRDIQRFANRYGDIFNGAYAELVRRPTGQFDSFSHLFGTSFSHWKFEIERMRALVNLWQAIKRKRTNELKKVIVWEDEECVRYRIASPFDGRPTLMGIVAFKKGDYNTALLARWRPFRDVVKPAQYVLQWRINDRLKDLQIAPTLRWFPGRRIDGVAQSDHHQRITFEPSNLLAAMWLQFAHSVATEKYQIQTCQICGESFHVGPGATRRDRKTCGARCRKRLSRQNK